MGLFLKVVGVGLLLAALLAGGLCAEAWMDRQRYGAGMMFADVELLGMAAGVFGLFGGGLLWIAGRMSRRREP